MGIKTRNAPPCFGKIAHLIARAETVCKPDDQKRRQCGPKTKACFFTDADRNKIYSEAISGVAPRVIAANWGCSYSYVIKTIRTVKEQIKG